MGSAVEWRFLLNDLDQNSQRCARSKFFKATFDKSNRVTTMLLFQSGLLGARGMDDVSRASWKPGCHLSICRCPRRASFVLHIDTPGSATAPSASKPDA